MIDTAKLIRELDRSWRGYRLVELRFEDLELIRLWRNAQRDVLRQKQPLSPADQKSWFKELVRPTHQGPEPQFLLVSILAPNDHLLGYGGLTNIDWSHRRAEISFLVDPQRSAEPDTYAADLLAFFSFLIHWAFEELDLNRLFTETYHFRSAHIELLELAGLRREGLMRQHIRTEVGFSDSLIHGLCRDQTGEPE